MRSPTTGWPAATAATSSCRSCAGSATRCRTRSPPRACACAPTARSATSSRAWPTSSAGCWRTRRTTASWRRRRRLPTRRELLGRSPGSPGPQWAVPVHRRRPRRDQRGAQLGRGGRPSSGVPCRTAAVSAPSGAVRQRAGPRAAPRAGARRSSPTPSPRSTPSCRCACPSGSARTRAPATRSSPPTRARPSASSPRRRRDAGRRRRRARRRPAAAARWAARRAAERAAVLVARRRLAARAPARARRARGPRVRASRGPRPTPTSARRSTSSSTTPAARSSCERGVALLQMPGRAQRRCATRRAAWSR